MGAEKSERPALADQVRPPRIAHAIVAALDLEQRNSELRRHLRPFVIRHQHPRGYREHFVGNQALWPEVTEVRHSIGPPAWKCGATTNLRNTL